jgi:hypothetical protein
VVIGFSPLVATWKAENEPGRVTLHDVYVRDGAGHQRVRSNGTVTYDATFKDECRFWQVHVWSGKAGEVATGRVDDAFARVTVRIGDRVVIPATEYENGAWEAETYDLEPLEDGDYEITATATAGSRLIGESTTEELRIDTVAPEVTVDFLTTQDGHPMLTGTVDDPRATVQVVVDGMTLTDDPMFGTNFDLNQGDGTWAGHIGEFFALDPGVYDVQVEGVDSVGNTGTGGTIGELIIGQLPLALSVRLANVAIPSSPAGRPPVDTLRDDLASGVVSRRFPVDGGSVREQELDRARIANNHEVEGQRSAGNRTGASVVWPEIAPVLDRSDEPVFLRCVGLRRREIGRLEHAGAGVGEAGAHQHDGDDPEEQPSA